MNSFIIQMYFSTGGSQTSANLWLVLAYFTQETILNIPYLEKLLFYN
jgi:hypothetical protein